MYLNKTRNVNHSPSARLHIQEKFSSSKTEKKLGAPENYGQKLADDFMQATEYIRSFSDLQDCLTISKGIVNDLEWHNASSQISISASDSFVAKNQFKLIINTAIKSLPNTDAASADILFPEQHGPEFAFNSGPMSAARALEICKLIENRLYQYPTPPETTVDEKSDLKQLLDFLAPLPLKSYLLVSPSIEKNHTSIISTLNRQSSIEKKHVLDMLSGMVQNLLVDLPDRMKIPAALAELDDLFSTLSDPAIELTKKTMYSFVEEIYQCLNRYAGNILSPDTPLTPTESAVYFLDAIETAKKNADQQQVKVIEEFEKRVKANWMDGNTTPARALALMQEAETTMFKVGLPELSQVAHRIVVDLSLPPALTRLYDNVYGRVWESYLMSELVKAPSAAMLSAAHFVGGAMAKTFSDIPRNATKIKVFDRLLHKLKDDFPRGWSRSEDQLNDLINSSANDIDNLTNFLRNEPKTGKELIARYHVVMKLNLSLKEIINEPIPWIVKADQAHAHQLPLRGRHKPHNFLETPGSGITMMHQQPTENADEYTNRAAVFRRYETDQANWIMKNSLEAGRPLAGGLSGTTNLMLHFIDHVTDHDKESLQRYMDELHIAPLDILYALLGLMIWLTHDGGHSLHEALWVVNDISDKVGIANLVNSHLVDEKQGHDYIPSYTKFFGSFSDVETKELLENSIDKAWTKTLQYREENMTAAAESYSPNN